MSKAFTREDDDAGFELAPLSSGVKGPITAMGARLAAEKVRDITGRLMAEVEPKARALLEMDLARAAAFGSAPIAARPTHEGAVSFGAEVRFRDERGNERIILLASSEEIGLVPHAASVTSKVARALLGAKEGDVLELEGPQGVGSLVVLEVRFPD